MRWFGAALLASLIPTLLLTAEVVPDRPYPPTDPQFRDVRLTCILGMTVEDPNAEELGTVRDLVLNVAEGRIEYVIVGSGGFLGLRARAQALPASALSPATIIRGLLSATITKAEWENAPAFHNKSAALASQLHRGQPGDPAPAPRAADQFQFTRELLGTAVLDGQHHKLGNITDFLVDLGGRKPPVAIVRARRLLHPDLCVAVPLPMLKVTAGDKLVLDANRRRLEQAPLFTEQAWRATPSHGANIIYRVPGSAES